MSIIKLKLILISVIIAVTSVLAYISVKYFKIMDSDKPPLVKIQAEIESYDNWAVFNPPKNTDGESISPLVSPYANKMLEDAQSNQIAYNISAQYSLGIIIEVIDLNIVDNEIIGNEWFKNNSWRYGFICLDNETSQDTTLNLRYVGVFPAEQMYYSGISLEEYIDSAYNSSPPESS
ncbi:MAG: hypothetical protein FWF94_03455 [Oscillospiraceae bacterium]|nr:hypothetical protein [Oscillospiraceae bacterium]